ncbi:MAG: hypothetical protein ACLQGP_00550 [Isosphaeraceae bacterium]
MQTIALSANAVAVLRFEIKGYRPRDKSRRLEAYRELAAAGIMEPVPGSDFDYRFTEDSPKIREEILDAAVAHLRSLEPRLPDRIELSEEARDTLGRHLAGDRKVTDANRSAYRELARAGIMDPVSGFVSGPEYLFRFTDQGWERRFEFLVCTKRDA